MIEKPIIKEIKIDQKEKNECYTIIEFELDFESLRVSEGKNTKTMIEIFKFMTFQVINSIRNKKIKCYFNEKELKQLSQEDYIEKLLGAVHKKDEYQVFT